MNRIEIAKRLPHSGAMVLLDRVVSWSDGDIVCSAQTHRDARNPLRTARGLSALAGIEYSGQAIALHASLTSREPHEGGVLAALRGVRWATGDLSAWDGELIACAQLIARTANAASYDFSLACGEWKVLAGTALVALLPTQMPVRPSHFPPRESSTAD